MDTSIRCLSNPDCIRIHVCDYCSCDGIADKKVGKCEMTAFLIYCRLLRHTRDVSLREFRNNLRGRFRSKKEFVIALTCVRLRKKYENNIMLNEAIDIINNTTDDELLLSYINSKELNGKFVYDLGFGFYISN